MKLKRVSAAFITMVMLVTYCAPTISYVEGASTAANGQWSTSETVSINVTDGDVRDVLSAVAMNLGYSIIYNGDVSKITVEINNVSPSAAFDYLVKIIGMSYIRDGNTMIVGKREDLAGNFARTLSLTKFRLKYITPTVLNEKINQVGIPVTIITVEANSSAFWVQGLPADVGKVKELITALDIPENEKITLVEGEEKAPPSGKTISYITFSQISAYEFNRFLLSLGIESGMSISHKDSRLWIYATPGEAETILELRNNVDRASATVDINATDSFDVIKVQNISKATAAAAVKSICPKLKIISIENASKSFFVNGSVLDIERARDLIAELDSINNNQIYTTFFVYNLQHISAAEAARRLAAIQFGDSVKWYTSTHEDIAASIFIYCNKDYQSQVIQLLEKIDNAQAVAVRGVPVYTSETLAEALKMQEYLMTMIGQRIDGAFKTFDFGTKTVLYLYGSNAESVKLAEDMIYRLGSVPSGEATNDISWEAFVSEVGEDVANGPNGMQLYGLWVKTKLSGSTTFSGITGFATQNPEFFGSEPVTSDPQSTTQHPTNPQTTPPIGGLDFPTDSAVTTGDEAGGVTE